MRKNSQTTDLILEVLETAVDGYVRLEDFLYNTHIYAKGYDRPLKKSNLSQSLRRLRLKGFLETEKSQNQILYKLTAAGRQEREIRKLLAEDNWDKKWRIVIFDIPESHRKVRNVLRSRLKLWKFKPLQKSVWVSKKSITKQVKEFVNDVGLTKWVLIFESSDLENVHIVDDR